MKIKIYISDDSILWKFCITGGERMRKICVAISCYNQEKYIEECVRHLLGQKYDGEVKILICDDASTDKTKTIILNTIKTMGLAKGWSVEDCSNLTNMGMPLNTKRILKLIMDDNADYGCILEGDDYWISPFWLEKHAEEMDKDKSVSMTNNYLLFYQQETNLYSVRQYPENVHKSKYITAAMQAEDNYSGNFSSSLYRVEAMRKIPKSFLQQPYVDDWFVNLLMAQQGKIHSIKEPLSVYRIHNQSVWNGKKNKKVDKMESTILKRIYFMHCYYPDKYLEELAAFSERWAKIPIKGKIYYDRGDGFKEENSLTMYNIFDEYTHFTSKLNMPMNVRKVRRFRYDPEEGYHCEIKNLCVKINGIEVEAVAQNGREVGETIVFETVDPIYKLQLPKSIKDVCEISIEGFMIIK